MEEQILVKPGMNIDIHVKVYGSDKQVLGEGTFQIPITRQGYIKKAKQVRRIKL